MTHRPARLWNVFGTFRGSQHLNILALVSALEKHIHSWKRLPTRQIQICAAPALVKLFAMRLPVSLNYYIFMVSQLNFLTCLFTNTSTIPITNDLLSTPVAFVTRLNQWPNLPIINIDLTKVVEIVDNTGSCSCLFQLNLLIFVLNSGF